MPQCCGLDGSSEIIPITNVTAILKEEHYKDSARLIRVLQSHGAQKTGPFYLVKGTCDQLDDLSVQLSAALKHRAGSDSGRSDCQQKQDSVSVSAFVMNYIQHKCSKELDRIAGSRFIIEIQPDASTATREGRRMLLVTFRPRNPSESQLHAHFVRQRFIVFYQKTASNLMTIYPPVSLSDSQELQRSFPELLFDSSWDRPGLTLTGNFAQVDLFGKCQKLLGCRDQTTISTSSANRREHEAESCPICLENIDVRKKQTLKCKHSFCSECLKRAFGYKPVCPACGKVYGVLMGTQPEGGQMTQATREASLPGYEQHGTIVIHYCIPSGIQQVRPQSGWGWSSDGAAEAATLVEPLFLEAFRSDVWTWLFVCRRSIRIPGSRIPVCHARPSCPTPPRAEGLRCC